MAVERARQLPAGSARDGLVLALLCGALSACAPQWLLQVAIDSGLREEEVHLYTGSPLHLTATALRHPSCSDTQREAALSRCSMAQLAALGREGCGEVTAEAIVTELRSRGPQARPMSPQLLENPSVAQVVLREPELHDSVFFAALGLLPVSPQFPAEESSGDSVMARYEAYRAAHRAWDSMWEGVVSVHTRRHRQLLAWSGDSGTDHVIRGHLLGTVPWDVEASLLEEVALGHLAGFKKWVVITRGCRMLRDGLSQQQVREHLAAELDSLAPSDLRDFETFLDEDVEERSYGLHGAVSWVQLAAEGTWRYILSPSETKHRYGKPHTWRASEELLGMLGRRFADTAVEALHLWEAEERSTSPSPRDLRWLHTLLVHLPELTVEVREKARVVLRHMRPRRRSPWEVDFATEQHDRELVGLRSAIEGILGDPAAAARNDALGGPDQITVQRLAGVPDDVLEDYLARHAGNDELIEKVMLALVSRSSYRPKIHFVDVWRRHSTPDAALLQVTTDLRKRLGGGPQLRESWARQVLKLPHCPAEVIRALPAWTALTVGGPEHGTAHTAVASLVTDALGDDEKAWGRFADSPASYSGPTAWLRLGDILSAAADGTPWPKPPTGR
jgi:hypothetical protein